jgi:RNA polymerase-binding transcription factor DksA
MVDSSNVVLRAQLQSERDRIVEQLHGLGGSEGDLSFDENFADSSQVTAERGEIEALAGTLSETLRDIEDALAKFDADTYGTCERCEGDIGADRLEAMPAARLCITCASQRR